MLSGGLGRVDSFNTRIISMTYVYPLLPGSVVSCADRTSARCARALQLAILARNNAFADSKLRCFSSLQITKESC